jgi:hypothetical protein
LRAWEYDRAGIEFRAERGHRFGAMLGTQGRENDAQFGLGHDQIGGMMALNAYNETLAGWEGRLSAGFPFRVMTTDAEHQRRASSLNAEIDRALAKVKANARDSYPSFSKGCAALR